MKRRKSPPPQPEQSWSGPPADPAPERPRRRSWFMRHKLLTLVLALLGIGALAQLGGGQDVPDTAAPSATPGDASSASPEQETTEAEGGAAGDEEPAESSAPKIGEEAAAGDFRYTVTSVKPGVPQIGDATFGQKPQGQFVLVELRVTNTGDEAQMFNDSEHKLTDAEGRQHSADSEAALYVPGNDAFLEDVNPGNTLEGTIVFDIPADAVPDRLTLMGPGFWDPAEVTVSLD